MNNTTKTRKVFFYLWVIIPFFLQTAVQAEFSHHIWNVLHFEFNFIVEKFKLQFLTVIPTWNIEISIGLQIKPILLLFLSLFNIWAMLNRHCEWVIKKLQERVSLGLQWNWNFWPPQHDLSSCGGSGFLSTIPHVGLRSKFFAIISLSPICCCCKMSTPWHGNSDSFRISTLTSLPDDGITWPTTDHSSNGMSYGVTEQSPILASS